MTKILLLDKVAKEAVNMLKKVEGFEVDAENELTLEQKTERMPDYDACVIRSATKFDKALLDAGKKLKLIIRAGEGTDNIDKPYAAEKGIAVENTPGQNSHAVAELALGHMFSLARHLPRADETMHKGTWDKKNLAGTELKGKTLGIIGSGKIGHDLAGMCKALGMRTVAFDVVQNAKDIEYVDMDTLLSTADYISIHVPLNDKTRDLIKKAELSKMKKTAYIINCARGGIINEKDLADAVKEGIIKGAAVDVYTEEPVKPENPLIGVPGILLTPHLGASTAEAENNCSTAAAEQIIAFFKENKVLNKVN